MVGRLVGLTMSDCLGLLGAIIFHDINIYIYKAKEY